MAKWAGLLVRHIGSVRADPPRRATSQHPGPPVAFQLFSKNRVCACGSAAAAAAAIAIACPAPCRHRLRSELEGVCTARPGMPLHLAHHKSYHPYSRKNQERVRRDQAQAEGIDVDQIQHVPAPLTAAERSAGRRPPRPPSRAAASAALPYEPRWYSQRTSTHPRQDLTDSERVRDAREKARADPLSEVSRGLATRTASNRPAPDQQRARLRVGSSSCTHTHTAEASSVDRAEAIIARRRRQFVLAPPSTGPSLSTYAQQPRPSPQSQQSHLLSQRRERWRYNDQFNPGDVSAAHVTRHR